MLDLDAGARCVGEAALGTDYNITRATCSTLFDEKIGGTFHMAVGASIPESGGVNKKCPALGSGLRPPQRWKGLRRRHIDPDQWKVPGPALFAVATAMTPQSGICGNDSAGTLGLFQVDVFAACQG